MKPKAFRYFRPGAGLTAYVCRWCHLLQFSYRTGLIHAERCSSKPVGR